MNIPLKIPMYKVWLDRGPARYVKKNVFVSLSLSLCIYIIHIKININIYICIHTQNMHMDLYISTYKHTHTDIQIYPPAPLRGPEAAESGLKDWS